MATVFGTFNESGPDNEFLFNLKTIVCLLWKALARFFSRFSDNFTLIHKVVSLLVYIHVT